MFKFKRKSRNSTPPRPVIQKASWKVIPDLADEAKGKLFKWMSCLWRAWKGPAFEWSSTIVKGTVIVEFRPPQRYIKFFQKWLGGKIIGNNLVYALAV